MDNVSKTQELDNLKLIYYEIINGASFDADTNFYIKHFSDSDNYLLLQRKQTLLTEYSKQGIRKEEELIKIAIKNEEWSEDKERNILMLKYIISDNEKAILNIIVQQRIIIQNVLEQKRKELSQALFERQMVIGQSVESLVESDINEYIAHLSFYRDKECLTPLLTNYDDFQNQDIEQIIKLSEILSKHCKRLNEESVQMISCLPFFLNRFSYCKDNMSDFFRLPIHKLTYHQSHLLSLGSRNLNVLEHAKGNPPDVELCKSLDEVVKWYNTEHSLIISRKK